MPGDGAIRRSQGWRRRAGPGRAGRLLDRQCAASRRGARAPGSPHGGPRHAHARGRCLPAGGRDGRHERGGCAACRPRCGRLQRDGRQHGQASPPLHLHPGRGHGHRRDGGGAGQRGAAQPAAAGLLRLQHREPAALVGHGARRLPQHGGPRAAAHDQLRAHGRRHGARDAGRLSRAGQCRCLERHRHRPAARARPPGDLQPRFRPRAGHVHFRGAHRGARERAAPVGRRRAGPLPRAAVGVVDVHRGDAA